MLALAADERGDEGGDDGSVDDDIEIDVRTSSALRRHLVVTESLRALDHPSRGRRIASAS